MQSTVNLWHKLPKLACRKTGDILQAGGGAGTGHTWAYPSTAFVHMSRDEHTAERVQLDVAVLKKQVHSGVQRLSSFSRLLHDAHSLSPHQALQHH